MRRNLQPTEPETPGQTPSLNDKCTGFFYVHYTTHGTYMYIFMSHPKDEAIMVLSVLLKDTSATTENQTHTFWFSDNTRTWVWCTRLLGHDTPQWQIIL